MPWTRLLARALLLGVAAAAQAQAQEGAGLAAKVERLLAERCAPCHTPDSDNRRARKQFDGALDLGRVVDELVAPGDPDFSDFWLVLDEGYMPPEDSEYGPVPREEQDVVRAWILAGAPLVDPPPAQELETPPEPGDLEPDAGTEPIPPAPASQDTAPRWLRYGRRLHPMIVHFPIALILTALLAEVLQGRSPRPGLGTASRLCLWLGALGALASALSGWALAEEIRATDLLERHRWFGVATAGMACLALVASELHAGGKRPRWRLVTWLALLVAAGLVSVTAHLGGSMVYGEDWFTP